MKSVVFWFATGDFEVLSLLRFTLLFFGIPLLILRQPTFQILRRLFQLVAVQQPATQSLEERTRTNVVGELFICFLFSSLTNRDEQLLVKCGEAALNPSQRQTAFKRDGPVRKAEREIIQSFSLKLRYQWTIKLGFVR